jgi:hypothetical protein
MDKEFFEWAESNDIIPTREHYLCFRYGKDMSANTINLLSAEIVRLHDIIRERNHYMGLG